MSRTTAVLTSAALAAWGVHTSLLTRRLRQARTDELTGLHRRAEFTRRSRRLLPHATVLLLDLDEFKALNDTFGHQAGDITLTVTADRLQAALPQAVCGRIGIGDELVATLPRPHAEQLHTEALLAALHRPVLHPAGVISPRVSIGLAPGPHHDGLSPALSAADAAMYAAKTAGGCAVVYDPGQHHAGRGRTASTDPAGPTGDDLADLRLR